MSRRKRHGQIAATETYLADDRDICLFCEKSEIEHRDENRNHIPCLGESGMPRKIVPPHDGQPEQPAAETPKRHKSASRARKSPKTQHHKESHMIKKLAATTSVTALAVAAAIGCSTNTARIVAAVNVGNGQYVCIYTPDNVPTEPSCDPRAAQFQDLAQAPPSVQTLAKAIKFATSPERR